MYGKDIFSKVLPNIKLSTRFDSDGNEIEVEIRKDEEQNTKQNEIFDLLVAAGYFRARIKGLNAFDKIVGSLVWCISMIGDYDVDFMMFNENLSIGQKIALTEKIVGVLPKMKCPFLIEPHQIQGLDFINIFPVIQWLVKRSVENRAEKAEKLKNFAVGQFHNYFMLKSCEEIKNKNLKLMENINSVEDFFGPKRQYRRKDTVSDDERTRVRITLLEYGNRGVIPKSIGKCDPNVSKLIDNAAVEDEISSEIDVEQLLKTLSLANEDTSSEYVELNEFERNKISQIFADLKSEMSIDTKELSEHNKTKSLLAVKTALEKKLERLEQDTVSINNVIEENQQEITETLKKQSILKAEIEELSNKQMEDENSTLEKVKRLVLHNEELKQKEIQFKEDCKKEALILEQKLKHAEEKNPNETIEESEERLLKEKEKLQSVRQSVAKQNRGIVSIQRQLDNIPDRTELSQYQRRFLELYNIIHKEHKETKQFYTLYNTLDDTKLYLEKELSILNSIYENYDEAMRSQQAMDDFMKQLEKITEGIKQSRSVVQRKRDDEKAKRDGLNALLLSLIEQERKYATAVKQLTKECQKIEILQQHMKLREQTDS